MPKITVDKELCKGCKLCLEVCPQKLLSVGEEFNSKGIRFIVQHDADKCLGCKLCGIMCPDSAINIYR